MTTTSTPLPTQHEPQLLGRTVVLIGGSAGIGLETARLARAKGPEVVLAARDPERLNEPRMMLARAAPLRSTQPIRPR